MKLYLVSEKIEFTSSSNSIVLPNTRFSNFGIFTSLDRAYQEAVGYYKLISLVDEEESICGLENYQSKIHTKSEILKNLKIQKESEELSPSLLVCKETQTSHSSADVKIWTRETKSIFIQVFNTNPSLY